MASQDLKLLVAREIACGETVAEVARRHGYSWKGMKKLVDKPDMQERIPKRLDAAKFVVEKILPNRTMLEAEVNVGISLRDPETQKMLDSALVQIADSLRRLSEAQAGQPGFMRHVYSGRDALPRPRLQAGSPSKVPPGAEGLPELPTEEA